MSPATLSFPSAQRNMYNPGLDQRTADFDSANLQAVDPAHRQIGAGEDAIAI